MGELITVKTTVEALVEAVWNCWTQPEHVTGWNHASDDWHSPKAESDFREGGRFSYRMEAKDGSYGFDFSGLYTRIIEYRTIGFTLDDGRKVTVEFLREDGETLVVEAFEAENVFPPEMQKAGWQAILDNFKKYTENNYREQ